VTLRIIQRYFEIGVSSACADPTTCDSPAGWPDVDGTVQPGLYPTTAWSNDGEVDQERS
jgi:hypothetical protein